MSTVLVCTGATVTFKSLIDQILSVSFVQNLINTGVTKLIVQYGNEIKGNKHISQLFFESTIKKNQLVEHLNLEICTCNDNKQCITFTSSNFKIECFPFSPQIDQYIAQSDVVISHAGTGSIIDVLHQHKKLIVVVNQSLMDNHQEEIANEFVKNGYCLCAKCRDLCSDEFVKSLKSLLKEEAKLKHLKENDGRTLESIICEELTG
ncbi:N-acetylglucosaminyldiphosphodolichol N-acetylglucosaminyltransferase catalytic subunit alg13 [Lodderomyces elongisporus]|uniref:N-acetylglucosaminyldiphosphodolichol N-acetylglucosaminyltransferase catalytic subunit alg13 n=1 Tax=Lodderomyces elongisporus TaxID=36914 RepID=UPI00292639F1|nr:N-acetylglucosaminyldiphosphodolichol N-acetylglucosaminyltransferase catalytic subunit alg13 [Lodderomyces elongisporus]WLF77619.1 N-acetylglucosaminyldiphosphodolichol N-acetylglucosaminyltransferase catalytic subunit alg13 [Lodderomyces elongisporus]